jgi:aspartate/methionine/tyrosine aminotransferase
VTFGASDGAFYFFLKVNCNYDSFELAKKLITDYGVAVIPGNTFGMEKGCYLRVAYGALNEVTAEEGLKRLVKGLSEIYYSANG